LFVCSRVHATNDGAGEGKKGGAARKHGFKRRRSTFADGGRC
jgi:hypothetical protein